MLRRRLLLAVLLPSLLAALALTGCGGDDDPAVPTTVAPGKTASAASGDAKISVSDNKFEPAAVTIKVNNEAIWEWKGSNPHSVVGTFQGEKVESLRLTGTGSFTFSFTKTGTFTYQCGVHGAGMSGTITVQ